MKTLLLLALALFGFMAQADTVAVENLLYDGSVGFKEINMTTEKTRTEYRQVTVPATCYRTEYRRHCEVRPPTCSPVCDRYGNCRAQCVPGGSFCRNIPIRVPYSCMRTETRAYEVHDYFVETKAKFQFNAPNLSDFVRENIKLKVAGERDTLTVDGSKNYFLVMEDKIKTETMRAGTKYIDLTYVIKLVPTREARDVLNNGIQNVRLRNGVISFRLGKGFNLNNFSQKIRIYQNKRFGTDPLLLERYLSESDMNIQSENNSSYVTINLRNLNTRLPRKMRVILNTDFIIDQDRLLNKGDVPTSKSANWVFR